MNTKVNINTLKYVIYTYKYKYMCMHELKYVHIFPNCPLRGPRSNDIPVAMSTPRTQILISKHWFSIKGTKVPWKVVKSKIRTGKYKMIL